MPGLIDVQMLGGHKYDGNLAGAKAGVAGLEGEFAGSKRGHIGGVAGSARGSSSPMSIEVPAAFYEDALKSTTGEEEDESPVVAVPSRPNGSMNGADHAPLYARGK